MPDSRPDVEQYVQQFNIPWPVGLGAVQTMEQLGVTGLPSTYVVARDGTIAWHNRLGGSLEDAIDQALAR